VLELGGSIGRNSCVINSLLEDKTQHVVIEPSKRELSHLEYNRDINGFKFSIENSAVSNIPLYSRDWKTYPTQVPHSVEVSTITYDKLIEKYNMSFNVLIIDNEGNFVNMLKSFPTILDNIRLLIIEHDFNSEDDIQYFYKKMGDCGFTLKTKYLKTSKHAPGMMWTDGVITDPIFVSAWERDV
jgi:FkbM family methyltransferase